MAKSGWFGRIFGMDPNAALKQRRVGEEASKTLAVKLDDGFIDKYLSGPAVLDIGYKGYIEDVVPVVPQAIGIELDYPGYDGRTLPFAEGSQDAVYASHCLEHIPDYRNAFRDWHRVLRVGGYLIIAVPHAFLYEKRVSLPSRFNADHKRLYTPASLIREVQDSLEPNSYRLRHLADNDLDYTYDIGPSRHSGGCYEIEMVIEKIATPAWRLATGGEALDMPPAKDPDAAAHGHLVEITRPPIAGNRRRILVIKLDHLGDFIIGTPALRLLRQGFADAEITLICGSWNVAFARDTGLFDRVEGYDFFPQNARVWDGKPHTPITAFAALLEGHYDVAIDMRAPGDTRFLLLHVDAALRTGLGSVVDSPFLDVALPFPHATDPVWSRHTRSNPVIPSSRFLGQDRHRAPLHMFTDFAHTDNFVFWGPYITLPAGIYDVVFDFAAIGIGDQPIEGTIEFDIAQATQRLAALQLDQSQRDVILSGHAMLSFENTEPDAKIEFRTLTRGVPFVGELRFFGVSVTRRDEHDPRLDRPSRLHVGEQLSLLGHLTHERVAGPDYPARLRDGAPLPPDALAALESAGVGAGTSGGLICIAPLSNSSMRDWPLHSYSRLIRIILDNLDRPVALLGTPEQHLALNEIVFACDHDPRVVNLAAATPWDSLPTLFGRADLVVANNSGVAHYAAACQARVLVLFSASHVLEEWAPRGHDVTTMMYEVPCSPCHTDNLVQCINEHACMVALTPEIVFARVASILATAPVGIAPSV